MRTLPTLFTVLVGAIPTLAASEISAIYNKVKSSVVVIETTQKEVSPLGMGQLTSVGGLGSGVLISADGQVMTAAHVVQAAVQIVVFQLWLSNPMLTQDPVGGAPLVNLLFLAYAVPAVFAFLLATALGSLASGLPARGLTGLGFLLVFAYLSLEVRHAFQGPVLSLAHQSDAEFYAYSLAWLVYAGLLLALGLFRGQTELRYASLAVLLVTVVKVFVFDMADLTGLLRVASFLGLGLSLVGIGFLYQRFVFYRPVAKPPPEAADAT